MLPLLTKIKIITSSARRKLVKESKQVEGFAQDTLNRNCFDVFEFYQNETKIVSFTAAVVHKSI